MHKILSNSLASHVQCMYSHRLILVTCKATDFTHLAFPSLFPASLPVPRAWQPVLYDVFYILLCASMAVDNGFFNRKDAKHLQIKLYTGKLKQFTYI